MTKILIVFFILSLVNVILNTLKTVLTVKASRFVACGINAFTYGFYNIVVVQLTGIELTYSIPITIITNLIGVYCSLWLLDRFKKDKLWIIEVNAELTDRDDIEQSLKAENIGFICQVVSGLREMVNFKIYSYSQKDSTATKEILKQFKVFYNIIESQKVL